MGDVSRPIEAVKRENEMMRKARIAEKDRCLKAIAQWQSADHIRLHAGEMTAQEMRSVKAVVAAVYASVQQS